MHDKKYLTSIIPVIFVFCSLPILAQNESMDANFQDPNVQDVSVVDVNLAEFAALQYAEKFYRNHYGALQLYKIETYYDLANQPAVYAITLTSADKQIPTQDELITEVKDKYNAIKQLKKVLLLIDSEPISGKAKSKLTSGVRIQIKQLETQLTQSDRFLTLLCGATKDHVPVIRVHRGLPEHITLLPSIEDKIVSTPELSNLRPIRVYYLGIFDQQYSLEPSNESKEKTDIDATSADSDQKLIHFRSTKVSSMSEIRQRIHEKKAIRDAEKLRMPLEKQKLMIAHQQDRKNKIKEKWSRIKTLYKQKKRSAVNAEGDRVRIPAPPSGGKPTVEKPVPVPERLREPGKKN